MAIASLYPTIKPSLLLDFANSKKLDPRVTFARSTTAAYYDGVTTAKAEENLLRESQLLFYPRWTLTNADPTGTLGSELVTNGTFDTDTTGWSSVSGGVLSVDTNRLLITNGNFGGARQYITVVPGKTYILRGTYTAGTATTGRVSAYYGNENGTAVQKNVTTGPFSMVFVGQGSTCPFALTLLSGTAGQTGFYDNVSVKEFTATYVTAPDGTTTATEFTADAADSTITQSVTAIAAEYTFSVYLRRVTGTGDIDITAHSGGTWVTQTITSSWARYTVTQTLTAGTRTPGIRIVTSGDQIEVWGAQLEQRSAATAYTPTTTQPITNYIPQLLTAPANVPRFDHVPADNPTTGQKAGESLGLLIEEQRTNSLTYSEEFDNGAWGKTAVTVTANTTAAPDGTTTADTLTEDTSNNAHAIARTLTLTPTQYIFSLYVKLASGTRQIDLLPINSGAIGSNGGVTFDSNLQYVATFGTGVTAYSTTPVGNGWHRLTVTATVTATGTATPVIRLRNAGTVTYTGDGTSGFYIWGAQLEAGAFPTSYIPTTSATVTRTQDTAQMFGANFSSWYNQNEGSFFFEAAQNAVNAASALFANLKYGVVSGNVSSVLFYLNNSARSIQLTSYSMSAAIQVDMSGNTPLLNQGVFKKAAFGLQNNNFAQVSDGGAVQTDTLGVMAQPTAMRIGGQLNEGTAVLSGTIKKLAYYPERLTNAQLQALTA